MDRRLVLLCASLALCAAVVVADEDLYCGKQSCYDILGVEPVAEAREVSSAYRRRAREVGVVGLCRDRCLRVPLSPSGHTLTCAMHR